MVSHGRGLGGEQETHYVRIDRGHGDRFGEAAYCKNQQLLLGQRGRPFRFLDHGFGMCSSGVAKPWNWNRAHQIQVPDCGFDRRGMRKQEKSEGSRRLRVPPNDRARSMAESHCASS